MKESRLAEIKKEYSILSKKYKLPDFSELNKEFEIEKIQERETDFLLREVRRAISDKIVAYLKFLELFLNPVAAPLFVLIALKGMNQSDKETMEKLYKDLVGLEIKSIALDTEYKESEEVKFIKEAINTWNSVKKDLIDLCKEIEKAHIKSSEKKKKDYFG